MDETYRVNILQSNTLGLGEQEVAEQGKENVEAAEEEEGVPLGLFQEQGEDLLQDGVRNVLGLGRHRHTSSSDLHALKGLTSSS